MTIVNVCLSFSKFRLIRFAFSNLKIYGSIIDRLSLNLLG